MTRSLPKICVVTGTRAEYGLLKHLLKLIADDPAFELQLVVTGSHLSAAHGNTVAEIVADGFHPTRTLPLPLDQGYSMAVLTARALESFAQAFDELRPSTVLVLGDRYEVFAAAAAAHMARIPIVHLYGGETTRGAIDDALRHAISHFATWHFTAVEQYRDRVIQLGGQTERVFCVGPIVIDGLLESPTARRQELEASTGYRFGDRNVLVTYHSETLAEDLGWSGFQALLEAIGVILRNDRECHVLFTYPNADDGSERLRSAMLDFVDIHTGQCWAVPSLGQRGYLQALRLFDVMAGNSSSGIVEAPLVGMPVVNVGSRQEGRIRYGNVSDVAADQTEILRALEHCLAEPRSTNGLEEARSSPSQAIHRWLVEHFAAR